MRKKTVYLESYIGTQVNRLEQVDVEWMGSILIIKEDEHLKGNSTMQKPGG